ncbi:hypothetical protein CEXT_339361 [Caerostris extrusa]|uniref:Uncharacterized protein n=1 Tax=Caerostris extrusa TaxID=172846 RepID=A0AAV4TQ81_CAEEX|nr:hypothetical protein CEXT_339361 [Caerostris extrusa]
MHCKQTAKEEGKKPQMGIDCAAIETTIFLAVALFTETIQSSPSNYRHCLGSARQGGTPFRSDNAGVGGGFPRRAVIRPRSVCRPAVYLDLLCASSSCFSCSIKRPWGRFRPELRHGMRTLIIMSTSKPKLDSQT